MLQMLQMLQILGNPSKRIATVKNDSDTLVQA